MNTFEDKGVETVVEVSEEEWDTVVSTDIGITQAGLDLEHTYYYKDGVLVGESEDVPNSVGGYQTCLLWGVGYGVK